MKWATVAGTSPLSITLDGDTSPLPFEPDSLIDPVSLSVNDRVRVEVSGRRVVIVGKAGGVPPFDPTPLEVGYRYVETVEFLSSGDFEIADYPWAKGVRFLVQAAGGAGYGATATSGGQVSGGPNGFGGGYVETDIIPVGSLPSAVPITVGAGGTGTSGGTGGAGGNSSAGTFATATGGPGASGRGATATPTEWFLTDALAGGTGGRVIYGGRPGPYMAVALSVQINGSGGDSALGRGGVRGYNGNGAAGDGYGSGGGGTHNNASQAARTGGAGAPGIVYVELYA